MKKVAIVILSWNSASVTIDCLISLLGIDYANFRIFLVDNGSHDNSVALIKEQVNSDKIEFIELESNYGFTGGNNIGIDIAQKTYQPDFYLLLNNDTIVDKLFLTELVESFSLDEKIGIVVPKIFFHEKPTYTYFAGGYINFISGMGEHYNWKKPEDAEANKSKYVAFANGCSMLIKAEVINTVGVLDDNFFANVEDVDFSYRVTQSGYKIYYNPLSVLWHREGYSSKRNVGNWFRIYLNTRNIIQFQRKRFTFFSFIPFLVYFSLRWVIYMSLKMAVTGEFKSIKSIYLGVKDGFTGKLRFVNVPQTVNFKL
jgi:GT2 family glycosyltransferase